MVIRCRREMTATEPRTAPASFTAAIRFSRLAREKSTSSSTATGKIYAKSPTHPNRILLMMPPIFPPNPKLLKKRRTDAIRSTTSRTSAQRSFSWTFTGVLAPVFFLVVFFLGEAVFFLLPDCLVPLISSILSFCHKTGLVPKDQSFLL